MRYTINFAAIQIANTLGVHPDISLAIFREFARRGIIKRGKRGGRPEDHPKISEREVWLIAIATATGFGPRKACSAAFTAINTGSAVGPTRTFYYPGNGTVLSCLFLKHQVDGLTRLYAQPDEKVAA